MDNVFAQATTDIERIIARVKREAAQECPPDGCVLAPTLDRCVRESVSALWSSRVKTFVPLLALRRVRCCIRAGSCDNEDF